MGRKKSQSRGSRHADWSELPLFQGLAPRSEPTHQPTRADASKGSLAVSANSHSSSLTAPLFDSPLVSLPDWDHLHPLPPKVRFGTSSWNYPGWFGQIYSRRYRSSGDTVAMLEEYARCPLFGCVGVDSTFYRPPSLETLSAYASVLPDGFEALGKVYDRFTIRRFSRQKKWGDEAGQLNPDFLNAGKCTDQVVGPWLEGLGEHAGPLLFEFQTQHPPERPSPETWADELATFFEQLPRAGRYGVELRNPELLNSSYFEALRSVGVAHVFNAWTRMPPIEAQMSPGSFTAGFVVARALLKRQRTYEEAVDRFKPYDRLQEPLPGVRNALANLTVEAVRLGLSVYVLVNNRLEGNSPGTIEAIRQILGPLLK